MQNAEVEKMERKSKQSRRENMQLTSDLTVTSVLVARQ
jgi:hypothetical protein